MKPQTFIFLGSSGSGKGTQARKIREFLGSQDEGRDILELGMGDNFRSFWKGEGHTERLSKKILDVGGLQPSFLQIYLWTQFFIEHLTPDVHLLIDGTPRRVEDSIAMDSALSFYSRSKPVVVYLKVTRAWAKKRLVERFESTGGHDHAIHDLRVLEDSDEEKIESRLNWFEEFALPAIDFFRDKPNYTFIEVDGERSIEDVHKEITQGLV